MYKHIVNRINQENISFFLLGVTILLIGLSINPYQGWGDDFALYIHQAKAMAEGNLHDLYLDNSLMMSYNKLGPNLYPPVYPLMLTLSYSIFGLSIVHFKLLNLFIFCGTLFLLYHILRFHQFSKNQIALSLLVITLNFNLLEYQQILYSDLSCLFTLSLFYFTILKLFDRGFAQELSWKKYIMFTVVYAFCLFSKTSYIIIIPALFISLILGRTHDHELQKNVKRNGLILLILTLMLLFINTQFPFNGGRNEIGELGQQSIWETVISNLYNNTSYTIQIYTKGIFELIVQMGQLDSSKQLVRLLVGIPFLIFCGLIILKFTVKLWKHRTWQGFFLSSFAVLYFGLYLVWPINQGPRFFFPLYLIFIPFSIRSLHDMMPVYVSKWKLDIVLAIIMSSYGAYYLVNNIQNKTEQIKEIEQSSIVGTQNFNQLIDYLSQSHATKREFIGCQKARLIHLYTGRKSIVFDKTNIQRCDPVVLLTSYELAEVAEILKEFNVEAQFGEIRVLKRKVY